MILLGVLKRFCILVIPLFFIVCVNPAPVAGGGLEEQLQGIIDTFLAENSMAPGVSACAICPALRLDWSGAAGTAAKGDSAPLTARHTFRIASNTKTYVAAAVMRLAESGRIELDAGLSEYLEADLDSLLRSDGYDTDAMTIAHVLSHTAGLGDHTDDPRFVDTILGDGQYRWTAGEQIRRLVEWRDPVGKPGEKYIYSDTGYIILGTIIERLTGSRLGPAVRALLDSDELGLEVTYWEYMEDPPDGAGPRAHQYFGDVDVTSFYASFDLYGGGGIVTDTRELTLFMRMLLEGKVLGDESTLDIMTSRGTEAYRLGLMFVKCGDIEAFGHQGFWNTFAFHVPALDLTVGGSILNHDAVNGRELMCRLVGAVAAAMEGAGR